MDQEAPSDVPCDTVHLATIGQYDTEELLRSARGRLTHGDTRPGTCLQSRDDVERLRPGFPGEATTEKSHIVGRWKYFVPNVGVDPDADVTSQ